MRLICSHCPKLEQISFSDILITLDCSWCTNLSLNFFENLPSSLQYLECVGCPNLTSIPENLPESLQELDCSRCPNLTSIPENLPQSIRGLYCSGCPKLLTISKNIHPLSILYCRNCPVLTNAPENIGEFTNYSMCPWLPQNSKNYPDRLPKLLICQRTVRTRRIRKFVKLTSSRSFNEYFFHPERQGGIWTKRRLEKQFMNS